MKIGYIRHQFTLLLFSPMQRRKFVESTLLLSLAGALSPIYSFGKIPGSRVLEQEGQIKMLRPDFGIFTDPKGGGTIAFLLSPEGIAVVDAQFPDQSHVVIEDLKKRGNAPFKYLINTHHHGDHTAGNIAYKGLVEHVVAHENSKQYQEIKARQFKSEDKQLYPTETYKDKWEARIGNEIVQMEYYGCGHTSGDSVVHFVNKNIVHMGDLVFNGWHPYIDRSSGANIQSWILILQKVISKFDKETLFIFGHGSEAMGIEGTLDNIRTKKSYLESVLEFGQNEIKAGISKEDFLKKKFIPGFESWGSDGIERPLTAVFEELIAG
jgi:cyclase